MDDLQKQYLNRHQYDWSKLVEEKRKEVRKKKIRLIYNLNILV